MIYSIWLTDCSTNLGISHKLDDLLEVKNGTLNPDLTMTAIAELFIASAPALKIYAEYCSNNQLAIDVVSQTKKHNYEFELFEKV